MASGNVTRQQIINEIASLLRDYSHSLNTADGTDVSRSGGNITTSNANIPSVSELAASNISNISGPAIETVLTNWMVTYSRVRRVDFTQTGCGVNYTKYARVNHSGADGTRLVPPSSTYDTLDPNDDIDDGTWATVLNNLRTYISANQTHYYTTYAYCHCSCHSSCHASRGRR